MALIHLYLMFFGISLCGHASGMGVKDVDSSLPDSTKEVFFFNPTEATIQQLQNAYWSGTATISEVTAWYLLRIESIDREGPGLNSIIAVNPDAMSIARKLDEEYQQGRIRGPLHGIPIVVKDNINTGDNMPTTAGSRALENYFAAEDSHLVKLLRDAGAVILGKANLSEWANFRGQLSTSGWSGLGGQTKNPYILDRNPCGSSSGSGVAVSANLCMIAIGTETNGSIVCPSHANGIVGIKPTVGLISRSGIIPISHSMDIAGPMARTVADAAIALGVLTEPDSHDLHSVHSIGHAFSDYTPFLRHDGLQGKRIGWYTATRGRHYKVDSLMSAAIGVLKDRGAEIVEINSIGSPQALSMSLEVMLYEYKAGLNRYFSSLGEEHPVSNVEALIAFNRQDPVSLMHFDQIWLERAAVKGSLSDTTYLNALAGMHRAMREEGIDMLMKQYELDGFVAPTGSPAWKTDHVNGDFYMLGSSSPAAIAGYPAITVPMGMIGGLPVGISFFSTAWSEPVLIEMAFDFEQATRHRQVPQFREKD